MTIVTGEQVRDAMRVAGITQVDHHDCGGCGYMTRYIRRGSELFFDPGCDCSRFGPADLESRSWDDAANWINMQTEPKWRIDIAKRFGMNLEEGGAEE